MEQIIVNIHASGTLCIVGKWHIFLLDISINSNCFEMTDNALEFHFSAIHILISVYVSD